MVSAPQTFKRREGVVAAGRWAEEVGDLPEEEEGGHRQKEVVEERHRSHTAG